MQVFKFMTSLLTFYLKCEIKVESNMAVVKTPNTILKVIPLGCRTYNMPVEQISGVNTSFSLDFKGFLIGLLVSIIGFAIVTESVICGLILFLLGICKVIAAFRTILNIEKTSGSAVTISFLIFEKKVAHDVEEALNNMISSRTDDTNVRVHTTQNTDRIIDAIKNNN